MDDATERCSPDNELPIYSEYEGYTIRGEFPCYGMQEYVIEKMPEDGTLGSLLEAIWNKLHSLYDGGTLIYNGVDLTNSNNGYEFDRNQTLKQLNISPGSKFLFGDVV